MWACVYVDVCVCICVCSMGGVVHVLMRTCIFTSLSTLLCVYMHLTVCDIYTSIYTCVQRCTQLTHTQPYVEA